MTINLWNQMFNWELRLQKISEMIQDHHPHLVALQEVLDFDGSSQFKFLQDLLPEYRFGEFRASLPPSSLNPSFPVEGLAILSRVPLVKFERFPLTLASSSPDRNVRSLLQARITHNSKPIDLYVVHMSYDRSVQCQHAHEILEIIRHQSHPVSDWLITGDLNVYNDHPVLAQIFAGRVTERSHYPNCEESSNPLSHIDVWEALHPNDKGFTFSNMPTPGLESRPDRMFLHSSSFSPSAVHILSGDDYLEKYYWKILKTRFLKMLANNPCPFDCGPRASCHCGVCVSHVSPSSSSSSSSSSPSSSSPSSSSSSPFPTPCSVPCPSCQRTHEKLKTYLSFLLLAGLVLLLLSFSLRRRKRRLFVLWLVFLFWMCFWGKMSFEREIQILLAILPEEFHPSDHRALVLELLPA